ncbi:MAG: CoA transferase [Chloroflexi bacterium]|nr:CoA transferase [Chloroflexota bacterium]
MRVKKVLPLQGYRVIDFGWVLVGPLVGMLLADMGAEVIKIETRKTVDSSRMTARNRSRDPEGDPSFRGLNRGKLGITVDMSVPKGAELLKELAKVSDVVVENFSPGVLAKYGLGYDELRRTNPQIVMVSLSGSGQSGPLRDLVTYGPTATALAGHDSHVGYYGERPLGPWGYADPNSAIYATFAVLSALVSRRKTGLGQYIDTCQWDTGVVNIAESIIDYTMNGRIAGTQGNRHPAMAPHNDYRCKGEDKWVSIAIATDDEWRRFCKAIGREAWLMDERFADSFSRLHNIEALDKLIGEWTINYTPQEATELLQRAGVAAMSHMEVGEQYHDPHFRPRFEEIEHPFSGKEIVAGVLWKLSDTPGAIRRPAPLIGQHNDYIFKELLGKSESEIGRLVGEKVIY